MIVELTDFELPIVRRALEAFLGPRDAHVRLYDQGERPHGLSEDTVDRWRGEVIAVGNVIGRLP